MKQADPSPQLRQRRDFRASVAIGYVVEISGESEAESIALGHDAETTGDQVSCESFLDLRAEKDALVLARFDQRGMIIDREDEIAEPVAPSCRLKFPEQLIGYTRGFHQTRASS